MPYGEMHAKEPEIMVRYGGYSPLEAIMACTRENAYAVGLENDVGVVETGKLADIIILKKDPVADIRVLQERSNLSMVIKDGRIVDLGNDTSEENVLTFQEEVA
jgi:imidazolonepropionase-like amidohydrolase